MNRICLPLIIFLVIAVPHQLARGEASKVVGKIDCSFVWCEIKDLAIIGRVDASTAEKFKQLIDECHERAIREKMKCHSLPFGLSLNSPGGSVTAALAIGRTIRKERMEVIVPVWANCFSACVLIYAGGVGRMNAGKLGIHRPYLEVPRQDVTSEDVRELYQKMLQEIRSYFREMNVSEQLADDMLRIEPAKIRLLDAAALDSYALTETDPIEQETLDLEDAQYWGLDRQEYIKRKMLVGRACPGRFGPDPNSDCYKAVMKTGRAPPQPDFSRYGTPVR